MNPFDTVDALAAHERMPEGRRVSLLTDADDPDARRIAERERHARYYARQREIAKRLGVSVRSLMGRTTR
jgi:hypothetical protein